MMILSCMRVEVKRKERVEGSVFPNTSETLDAWREDDVWIWSKKGQ